MKTKLLQLWISLRSSFWFIPALLIFAAVVLAFVMVGLDAGAGADFTRHYPRVFGASPEGARSILSGVASSMISIAGVTFSITIVALSLTSAQYTSRVLRNFMRDRANQAVLGVFLSIFVYCLIVLRTVRGGSDSFVPALSLMTGIVLGIIGIAFLIFFIHHVANSIQAATVISNIGRETIAVIAELYPEPCTAETETPEAHDQWMRENFWTVIPSACAGYVQTVDAEGLMAWAEQNQTIVLVRRGIGEFVIAGQPIAAIARTGNPPAATIKALNACFSVSSYRTSEQDVGFGIRKLVDISLKALSPGINDTTTAVTCLHYLGAVLNALSRQTIPAELCRRDGQVRLIARTQSYAFLVAEALDQIRQVAGSNVVIHCSLLEAIGAAHHPELGQARRKILLQHAAHVLKTADANVPDDADRATIRSRFDQVVKTLDEAV